MDEPTAGLDPSERIRIRNFLSTISENKIIIVATHIVSDIESVAKEIILLKNGEILSAAKPENLLMDIRDQVYEITVGINENFNEQNKKISNIRVDEDKKIYRIVSDSEPIGYDYKSVAPGLEELYLYHFL